MAYNMNMLLKASIQSLEYSVDFTSNVLFAYSLRYNDLDKNKLRKAIASYLLFQVIV